MAKKNAKKPKDPAAAAKKANKPARQQEKQLRGRAIDTNEDALLQNIAVAGSKAVGTNLGDPREIIGANIDPAATIDPNTARIDQAQQAQFRAQQMGLAKQLELTASGQGPSIAEQQLRAAQDTNIANQAGFLAANAGTNPALAARVAAQGAGQIGTQTAQQGAQLRLAEAIAAQQELGQLSTNARGQDIGLAQNQAGIDYNIGLANTQAINQRAAQQAGLKQEANLANQSAFNLTNVSQGQINEAIQRAKLDAASRVQAAGLGAGAAITGAELQFQSDQAQREHDAAERERDRNVNAQGPTTSDERAKKNVKSADVKIRDFLNALDDYSFEYAVKNEKKGEHIGVMAQDLEKTAAGKDMVTENKDGYKAVDFNRGMATILAAQASLNKRLAKRS